MQSLTQCRIGIFVFFVYIYSLNPSLVYIFARQLQQFHVREECRNELLSRCMDPMIHCSFRFSFSPVTPKEPVIKMDGRQLSNGTLLGPYMEGTTVVLDCVSSGGRPAPQVLWRNTSANLPVKTSVMPDLRGIHDVTSTARFVLSRWDLGAKLECVVVTKATSSPVVKWVQLDVHGMPTVILLLNSFFLIPNSNQPADFAALP